MSNKVFREGVGGEPRGLGRMETPLVVQMLAGSGLWSHRLPCPAPRGLRQGLPPPFPENSLCNSDTSVKKPFSLVITLNFFVL